MGKNLRFGKLGNKIRYVSKYSSGETVWVELSEVSDKISLFDSLNYIGPVRIIRTINRRVGVRKTYAMLYEIDIPIFIDIFDKTFLYTVRRKGSFFIECDLIDHDINSRKISC